MALLYLFFLSQRSDTLGKEPNLEPGTLSEDSEVPKKYLLIRIKCSMSPFEGSLKLNIAGVMDLGSAAK